MHDADIARPIPPAPEKLAPGVTEYLTRGPDGKPRFDGMYQVGRELISQAEYEKYFLGSA